MHFVTESELRTTYHKEAFTEFCLTNQQRLTPGAKQFILDKKIQIISEADLKKKHDTIKPQFVALDGYKELLSSELFEAALLAMDQQLAMSQQLIDLEKWLMTALRADSSSGDVTLPEVEAFQLEPVHIFSKQGSLLIKLKKVAGIIQLIQAEYPQCSEQLMRASQQINELKKQIVGGANEKTIHESM